MSLDGLAQLLRDSCGLVGVYGRDGWLLHMACNDHIKADFDSQHNAIIDAMEVCGQFKDVPSRSSLIVVFGGCTWFESGLEVGSGNMI